MMKNKLRIVLAVVASGVTLLAFQNFTRYKPENHSRAARDLYMGSALSTALKEADELEKSKQVAQNSAPVVEEKAKNKVKPAPEAQENDSH
jgi:hypothetical protein